MRGTLVITRKELRQLFSSPIAYVALAMFFVVNGFLFYALVGGYTVWPRSSSSLYGPARNASSCRVGFAVASRDSHPSFHITGTPPT